MTRQDHSWNDDRIARLSTALIRFGQIGFWVQLVLLIAIAILGGYVLKVLGTGVGLANLLSLLGLLLPLFTTLWCRHYATLGRKLADPAGRPGPGQIRRAVWIGVWAGTAGVVVTMLSLLGAASGLMVTLLANPQIGVPVATITGTAGAYQVSAVDAISLMSLLITQAAELMVVAISLRLVFLLGGSLRALD